MRRSFMFLALFLILPVLAFAANPGDVRINEVMYDDTASADQEWVELYNTTGAAIDVSGWYLTDDDLYPAGGEGSLTIPAATSIPAYGYIVCCEADFEYLTGEIVCTEWGSFNLGNSGDNISLWDAATGGTLIDGSLAAVKYPDEAPSNTGTSVEKIVEFSPWSNSGGYWNASTNVYSATGRYRYCTPGAQNSAVSTASPGDVRINEVMYDDTASGDHEWAELFNTTDELIDISGWYLSDDDAYPRTGEGALIVPANTALDSYLVVTDIDLPEITGEVLCTEEGSWGLGNSGDELNLYDAATGGTLIDGSLTVKYRMMPPAMWATPSKRLMNLRLGVAALTIGMLPFILIQQPDASASAHPAL